MRASERNGLIVGAHSVMENDALMLITTGGKMIRINVADIRVISRVTQGVRLINLDEGDSLVSVTKVEPEDADDTAQEEADAKKDTGAQEDADIQKTLAPKKTPTQPTARTPPMWKGEVGDTGLARRGIALCS